MDTEEIQQHKCPECFYSTNHWPNLNTHILQVHEKTDRKRIRSHPVYETNCPCHPSIHHLDSLEELRLHIYYFHRHGGKDELKSLGYDIEEMRKYPNLYNPSFPKYKELRIKYEAEMRLYSKWWKPTEQFLSWNISEESKFRALQQKEEEYEKKRNEKEKLKKVLKKSNQNMRQKEKAAKMKL